MLLATLALGCALTHHPVAPATLGVAPPADWEALLEQPGPVTLETVASADWEVPLSGLLNLDDPRAREAGLSERQEPIQVYFHAISHPEHGLYLVDTGVESALRDAPQRAAVRGLAARAMHVERMSVNTPLGAWLDGRELEGVLLTHMHLDHLTGMADVPEGAVVYSGPGEARAKSALNLLVRGPTERALAGKGPIQEWAFRPDPHFEGVLDVFGDQSVFALWVPGHTPGSTAYVVRTTEGPVLLTGDASHTRWGWEHGVAPGTFTADAAQGETSLEALEALARRHPTMEVRLGHQR